MASVKSGGETVHEYCRPTGDMRPLAVQKVKEKIWRLHALVRGAIVVLPFLIVFAMVYSEVGVLRHYLVVLGAFIGVACAGLYLGERCEKRLYGEVLQAMINDLNMVDDREAVLSEYGAFIRSNRVVRRTPDLVLEIGYDPPEIIWVRQCFIEYLRQDTKSGLWKLSVMPRDEEATCDEAFSGTGIGATPAEALASTTGLPAAPRQVTVLLGIVEDAIEEFITENIQNAIPGHAALTVRSVSTLPDIWQATAEGKIDLAVLLLNNIVTMGKDDRPLASALAGVRHLESLGVPVISICGYSVVPHVADLAFAAGSRFYFPAPFDAGAFQAAVRQCLGPIPPLPAEVETGLLKYTCSACGSPYTEADSFCVKCKVRLPKPCQRCGALGRPGASFCDKCGHPI